MKLLLLPVLLISLASSSQTNSIDLALQTPAGNSIMQTKPFPASPVTADVKIGRSKRWKLDHNKILTGGLLFTAGLAKGFNEALEYRYNGFEDIFPKANDQWFYPTFSYNNKYKDNDPTKGAKFPLSTSVLVMFTDQFHLNNFIQRTALTGALIVKIGEGKRPLKQYLFDLIYYTACYQLGFHSIYAPISMRNLK
jgi:hypothetical protein